MSDDLLSVAPELQVSRWFNAAQPVDDLQMPPGQPAESPLDCQISARASQIQGMISGSHIHTLMSTHPGKAGSSAIS